MWCRKNNSLYLLTGRTLWDAMNTPNFQDNLDQYYTTQELNSSNEFEQSRNSQKGDYLNKQQFLKLFGH